MMDDGIRIPLSRRASCSYCQCVIDTNATGVFQLAIGWLQNRRAGGANQLFLPKRRNQYACADCIDRIRKGIPPGQQSLFDSVEYGV